MSHVKSRCLRLTSSVNGNLPEEEYISLQFVEFMELVTVVIFLSSSLYAISLGVDHLDLSLNCLLLLLLVIDFYSISIGLLFLLISFEVYSIVAFHDVWNILVFNLLSEVVKLLVSFYPSKL